MGNKIEVTVVLPVYNVAKYLEQCIQSVINQTYREFELILVDDGSTDGSQYICDKYHEIDNRILVIHQNNGGLSAARNTGIRNASGKYITFIDSDDFVDEKYLEILYGLLIRNQAEISVCDYCEVNETAMLKDIVSNNPLESGEYVFDSEEAIKEVYLDNHHGIEFVSWAKMYKIELFTNETVFFPEGRLHEDTFTTYKLFYKSNKIAYKDDQLYFYRIRKGSIMNSDFSKNRLDMIYATREIYRFFMEVKNFELMRLAFFDHLHKVKLIIKMMCCSNEIQNSILWETCNDLNKELDECNKMINMPFFKYIYYKGLSKFPKMFVKIR